MRPPNANSSQEKRNFCILRCVFLSLQSPKPKPLTTGNVPGTRPCGTCCTLFDGGVQNTRKYRPPGNHLFDEIPPEIPTDIARRVLYLAVVLDLFTRKVVGWGMRDHMRAELTIAALTMTIQRRRPAAGLIRHTDRGSQYAAGDYCKILQAAAILQSMSRKANCWDNAPMEGFLAL